MLLRLILGASLVTAVSGLPGLLLPRRSAIGQRIAVTLMVLASTTGLIAALCGIFRDAPSTLSFPGVLPGWFFSLKLDALSGFFLFPIYLLGLLGPVYGQSYWRQADHPRNGRRLSLCYGTLIAGLSLVTLAADGISFLFAWEVMALSAFFLVGTEDHNPEARQASWIYIVATHIGTLALFALFALLRLAVGSFELRRLDPAEAGFGFQSALFLLALLGFGLKAGAMPLHFWLPPAHAAAPSHVSAILSGVVLKIGIYGLVRTMMLLSHSSIAWGVLVLLAGIISAVLGVVFALGQHDLKRLLAYHSIENIGIILIGLGVAMIGTATQRVEWIVLGLGGGLLHVWNHSLFKSLLFLSAGAVVHAAHTREIDHLGGLAHRMPWTALMFAAGAVAICGLPPMNGFVSELLMYLGLFRTAADKQTGFAALALAAPILAMVGALALACFVKAYGAVFLGTARTATAAKAHEPPLGMLAPMALLALICAAIGMFPILVFPLLDRVILLWPGATAPRLGHVAPQMLVTVLSISLVLSAIAIAWILKRQSRRQTVRRTVTWDCGYVAPRSSIQYTASSFAAGLVALFGWVLRPHVHYSVERRLFAGRSSFGTHVSDLVLDGWMVPAWSRVKLQLASLRVLQQGRVQRYLLYILLALFGLLLSLVPVMELVKKVLGR